MSSLETSRRDFMGIAATAGLSAVAVAGAQAQLPAAATTAVQQVPCTLLPQQNATRSVLELAGLWDFQLDPWAKKLPNPKLIAVPGSWNEQFQDTRDYTGVAWYQTTIQVPRAWRGERIILHVGSTVYHASIWLDGQPIGEHLGGHLPFAFEITPAVAFDRTMTLAIRVENIALPTRVPLAGNSVPGRAANFPDINYDFFPYSGLHRAVTLYTVPRTHIADITVVPGIEGTDGLLRLHVAASDGFRVTGSADAGGQRVALTFDAGVAEAVLRVPAVQAWHPTSPHLYDLTVTLGESAAPTDAYRLQVGVLTIEVRGDQFLLNGQPIQIRGAAAPLRRGNPVLGLVRFQDSPSNRTRRRVESQGCSRGTDGPRWPPMRCASDGSPNGRTCGIATTSALRRGRMRWIRSVAAM